MKTFFTTTLTICCLMGSFLGYSQNQLASLSGRLIDEAGQPVPFANLALYRQADTSLVKVAASEENGTFTLLAPINEALFLEVTFVGYETKRWTQAPLGEGEDRALGDLNLASTSQELDEVTVTAERPMLEVKPDKLVFNVEGSVNAAGNTALELLRKSPGVVVDNNNNILLAGRSGVQIYINGKLSPYAGEDLSNFLQSLQSDQIDAIEVITNPSARYDAQGNGGIINIRLKKDQNLGANATVNLGSSVGLRPMYNGGINANYRNQKVNLYGSYNYGNQYMWNEFFMLRQQPGGEFDQETITESHGINHSAKLGADFFLSEKSTLGFLVNGFDNARTADGNTITTLSSTIGGAIDSLLLSESNSEGTRSNYNANLNYQWVNGDKSSWNIDLDYGWFRNGNEQQLPNRYVTPNEEATLSFEEYFSEAATDIDILTFRIDREQQIGKGRLEAGFKTAYVRTDNDFDWFDVEGQNRIPDLDRTNQFEYTEQVQAAYASYSVPLGEKWRFQAGLRGEYTSTEGILTAAKETANARVDSTYFNLFPSGGLTYNLNPKNSFRLNYSRRINRPSYQDLNPFEFKSNELSFRRGNPFLRPEYTHNIQLSHTFNYRYNTSISYSVTNDLITNITDIEGEKGSFITFLNLAEQRNYSASFSAPITITDWWSSYSSVTAYRIENEADYGDGRIINLAQNTLSLYSQQTFNLGKGIKAELSGWYQSPSIWGGTFETDAIYAINAGFQTDLLNGQANLRISVNDIFFTSGWTATSVLGQLYQEGAGNWDARRLQLNLTYKLGNQKVKAARKRSTGLEEQAERIKSDG